MRKKKLKNWSTRILILIASFILLILIFSASPIDLHKNFKPSVIKPILKNDPAYEFLIAEHTKAVDEIKMRIEHRDQWFHYKFLLIGALIAGFFTLFKSKKQDANQDNHLERLLKYNATCFALALGCVVAVAIDIHIRKNMIVVQQLGLWIHYYVEPVFSASGYFEHFPEDFYFWEQFLRISPNDEAGVSMHSDYLYIFMYWPHLHFLTFVLYMFYLIIFQEICLQSKNLQKWYTIAGFVFVHASILAFTVISHVAPTAFEYNIPGYGLIRGTYTPNFLYYSIWGFGLDQLPLYQTPSKVRCMTIETEKRAQHFFRIQCPNP